jgi:hypothetical protein
VHLLWPNASFVKRSASEILFCAFNDKALRGHLPGLDTDFKRIGLIWIKRREVV